MRSALALLPTLAWSVLAGQFTTYTDESCTEQLTFYSSSDIGSNCVTISDDAVGVTARWGASADSMLIAYSDEDCTTVLGTLPSDHSCWVISSHFSEAIKSVNAQTGPSVLVAVP
ncbi:hypothetical protein N0V93_008741 [Gnomoniopsis smithogilvyi]|uniref:Uncharacterized protein n=1 Tax=Gnomoniopsis smithogilvyi TaxID=1191159 RepID=A0A9W8YNA8_9PEZI|nr:hypothetical protein N0V93_008741 [Gnomoniopsis smithogilvyi]